VAQAVAVASPAVVTPVVAVASPALARLALE
jgi:hypothetical protein